MKQIIIGCLILLNGIVILAQKPVIDSSVYGKWPELGQASISSDGKFVMYSVENEPVGGRTIVVRPVAGGWKRMFGNSSNYPPFFTQDSRKATIPLKGDSVAIVTLGNGKLEYLTNARNPRGMGIDNGDWLAYQTGPPENECIVRNIQTGRRFIEGHALSCEFNEAAKCAIICVQNNSPMKEQYLVWLDLQSGSSSRIWSGKNYGTSIFDMTGDKMAILGGDSSATGNLGLWMYEKGRPRAELLLEDPSARLDSGYCLTDKDLRFSKDGKTLFFTTDKKRDEGGMVEGGVNIWNYKDPVLQSAQIKSLRRRDSFVSCAVQLSTRKIVTLVRSDEMGIFQKGIDDGKFILVTKKPAPDAFYNPASRRALFLESVENGSRTQIMGGYNYNGYQHEEPVLSPDEQYVVWFDLDSLCYFSYEIATGIKKNLSQMVPADLYDKEGARIGRYKPYGVAGWLANDRKLLLYDQYDIWEVDPHGTGKSVNISLGRGRNEQTVFGIIHPGNLRRKTRLAAKGGLLIGGFNRVTKESGFWILDSTGHVEPRKCVMDGHAYCIERVGALGTEFKSAGRPVKAQNADVYLVRRMSCRESPNLFVTTDFSSFRQVSDVSPEKHYNWLTSKLINWTLPNGEACQGILYLPENFDSTRKYPLIFEYYEGLSDGLNTYHKPDYCNDRINIPSYVSNGYLVFTPDIHFVLQKGGRSVVNCIVSAANYLSGFPWVDPARMGLQGHSFGGWETNYLITHSRLFAAACEASGISNIVSDYGQIAGDNEGDVHVRVEMGQGYFGLGVTPWTAPQAYVENSPIFHLDSVLTPLLMMHTRLDGNIPFAQAVELFTGLKRAGKKVWLLEYEKGDHSVFSNDAKDYTMRMQQFFDYYLKGTLPPKWMTRGIPASQRGKERGLELDSSGFIP